MLRLLLACALALGLAGGAHALTPEQARAIAAGDSTDARIAALNQAVQTADARTAAFVDALANDAVKLDEWGDGEEKKDEDRPTFTLDEQTLLIQGKDAPPEEPES